MEYLEFEKNIKSKLSQDQITFDVKQFMIDIDQKKNNRKYLIWLVGFLAILLTALGSFAYLSSQHNGLASIGALNNTKANSYALEIKDAQEKSVKNEVLTETNEAGNSQKNKKGNKAIVGWADERDDKLLTQNKVTTNADENDHKPISISSDKKNDVVESTLRGNVLPTEDKVELNAIIDEVDFLPHNAYIPISNERPLFKLEQIDCPDFNSSNGKGGLEIIAEVGVFKPMKTIDQNNTEMDVLTALRQQNEESKLGLHAGLFAKYNLKRLPFYIFGGLDYSRTVEKMSLDYEIIERDTTIGVVSITESVEGDTITYIYGEIFSENTITGSKTRHYTISTIDIPIHVGYELNFNKLSAGAELGAALNIKTMTGGNFISSTSDFVETEDAAYFKDRLGLRFDARLVLGYQINSFGKIYTSLSFNSYPGSVSVASSGVDHRYNQVGLNLGYGMRF